MANAAAKLTTTAAVSRDRLRIVPPPRIPPAACRPAAVPSFAGQGLLEVLCGHLEFLLGGGYTRGDFHWRPKWALLDAPQCRRGSAGDAGTCSGCPLAALAAAERKTGDYACYSIAVGDHGETMGELVATGDVPRIEKLLEAWLRSRIAELEAQPSWQWRTAPKHGPQPALVERWPPLSRP